MPNVTACLSEIDRLVEGGNQILLATDFDGTLCTVCESPSNVVVPKMILESLRQLSNSPGIAIAVISGRTLDDLTRKLPLPVVLAGNNGLAIRGPAFQFEYAGARLLRPKLAEACLHLAEAVARWKGAQVEDKALTATVHYRNVNRVDHYALIRAVRQCMAAYDGLFGMRAGLEAIEIHPRGAWDKGTCLRWIKRRLTLESSASICIGDDLTDESMFEANVNQMNIKVGTIGRSAAGFQVADVYEVAALLAHLERAVRLNRGAASLSLRGSKP
jgi:trehalose-phosphatase